MTPAVTGEAQCSYSSSQEMPCSQFFVTTNASTHSGCGRDDVQKQTITQSAQTAHVAKKSRIHVLKKNLNEKELFTYNCHIYLRPS